MVLKKANRPPFLCFLAAAGTWLDQSFQAATQFTPRTHENNPNVDTSRAFKTQFVRSDVVFLTPKGVKISKKKVKCKKKNSKFPFVNFKP